MSFPCGMPCKPKLKAYSFFHGADHKEFGKERCKSTDRADSLLKYDYIYTATNKLQVF